jgi:hypothetical protein
MKVMNVERMSVERMSELNDIEISERGYVQA